MVKKMEKRLVTDEKASMELLTPKQAAELLLTSVNALATWRCRKKGPPDIKVAGIRYWLKDIHDWLERKTIHPTGC
jgi:hypothetical protein